MAVSGWLFGCRGDLGWFSAGRGLGWFDGRARRRLAASGGTGRHRAGRHRAGERQAPGHPWLPGAGHPGGRPGKRPPGGRARGRQPPMAAGAGTPEANGHPGRRATARALAGHRAAELSAPGLPSRGCQTPDCQTPEADRHPEPTGAQGQAGTGQVRTGK